MNAGESSSSINQVIKIMWNSFACYFFMCVKLNFNCTYLFLTFKFDSFLKKLSFNSFKHFVQSRLYIFGLLTYNSLLVYCDFMLFFFIFMYVICTRTFTNFIKFSVTLLANSVFKFLNVFDFFVIVVRVMQFKNCK